MTTEHFHHPHDTPVSAGLRFLSELIAWVAGPWAITLVSSWLVLPAIVLLVGLPGVFSTINDKRNVIVPTPGPVRVGIELFLYSVAIIAPWFVWSTIVSIIATGIVIAALVTGIARMSWLMDGAPSGEAGTE
jgi:hypothetical protein